MVSYFKGFKDYIPTWCICLFMFFWIFGWTFLIAIVLMVIQHFQIKKTKKEIIGSDFRELGHVGFEINPVETENIGLENEVKDLQNRSKKLDEIIKAKEEKIESLDSKINSLYGKIKNFDKEKFVLSAGKYRGGKDIPIGTYIATLVSGIGLLETNKPEDIYFRMTNDKNDMQEYGWINKYHNLEISEETILKIQESAKIEFVLSREYDFTKEIEEQKKE